MNVNKNSQNRVAGAVLLFLAVFVFSPSLGGVFLFDDIPAVVDNPLVQGDLHVGDIFSQSYWGEREGFEQVAIYRPLVTLSFALNEKLTPDSVVGFRWVNVLLHGAVTWIVFLLFRRFYSLRVAFIGGLAFALHAVHADAVVAIANRTELLAALMGLLSCLFYLKGEDEEEKRVPYEIVSWVFFFVALGSKESAIMLPFVLLLWEMTGEGNWRHRLQKRRGWYLAVAVLIVGYLFGRAGVLLEPFGGATPWVDNPLQDAPGMARWLTPLSLVGLSAELLIAPLNLSVDYTFNAFPLVTSLGEPGPWVGLAVIGGFIGALGFSYGKKEWAGLRLGVLLCGLSYGLVSHFIFPGTILFAERLLYLPSVGFLFLILSAISQAKNRTIWLATALVWSLGMGALSWNYAAVWKSPKTLFEFSLASRPESARMHTNLGHIALESGDLEEARKQTDAALQILPDSAEALVNRGAIAEGLGENNSAEIFFERGTKSLGGRYGIAHVNLCRIRVLGGNIQAAKEPCETGVTLRPDLAASWVSLGRYYEGMAEWDKAESHLKEGVRREIKSSLPLHELGGYYSRRGDGRKRLDVLFTLYGLNPTDRPLRDALARETARTVNECLGNGDQEGAKKLLLRGIQSLPNPGLWQEKLDSLEKSGPP